MKSTHSLALIASRGLAASAQAHESAATHGHDSDTSEMNWGTGEGADFFGISPNFYLLGGFGASTADDVGELANGHHDPNDDYTLQAAEVSLSARWGKHIQAQFNHSWFSEVDGGEREYHHETEELFLKLVELPFGFEARGGLFLNRFGFQNAQHNHSWDFVNQNLSNGAILQEGELSTIGGELTWNLPTEFPAAISLYAGDAPEHEEEMDPGPPPLFEGHEGELDEDIFGFNFIATFNASDFHQFAATASVTHGQNHFETDTTLAGLGLQYQWRENGLEPGGRSFTLRGEAVYRTFEAINEIDPTIRKDVEQFGTYFSQIYEHNSAISFANRFGYVTGDDEAELTERFRVSQAVTWYANENRNFFTRLQLDNDWIDGNNAHDTTIWFQIGMHWGPGNEVR